MINQFTNDKGVKYLFVEVPVDAYDFVIRQADRIYESHNQVLAYKTPTRWERFKKENWNWSTRSEKLKFIGLSKDLTEDLANAIVDSKCSFTKHFVKPESLNPLEEKIINGETVWIECHKKLYKDYFFKPHYRNLCHAGSVPAAIESLSTLIIHLGFKETDNVAVLEVTG